MLPSLNRRTRVTLGLTSILALGILAGAGMLRPISAGAQAEATATPAAPGAASAEADRDDAVSRPPGWSAETHSNEVPPNYDVVFPIDAVNTLTITIAPNDWAAMQADMEDIYGAARKMVEAINALPEEKLEEFAQAVVIPVDTEPITGSSSLTATAPISATEPATAAAELTATAATTAGAPLPAAPADNDDTPVARSPKWVPATIHFQGREWLHVGVRYKGASSLSPWLLGDLKLPFKFNFDRYDDDFPEIAKQRFFGFKELSLANNYQDAAGMRDTLVYDLLEEAGLPSLHTAPYEVVLDYGEGPVRLGLYTLVETVDGNGILRYFGSDDGNIYEGEGAGSTLAVAHADQIEADLQKKNNEDEEDWSDIWGLYDVLHDPVRTSDPAAWRSELEAVFDVDGFLEWLGIGVAIGHVDTYGLTPHNFYLYNDPAAGKLTWVSWDHNVTFREDMRPFVTLDKARVTDEWPLIRYLLDDPVYWDRYVELLAENFATVLDPEAIIERVRARADLLAPYAALDMSAEEYKAEVQAIVDYVESSASEVEAFLAAQE